jgi:hypothetical protein
MPEKKLKVKDMTIAIFCTLLAILCIVFYFLPAFNVKHRIDTYHDWETINYSGWQMTQVIFKNERVIGGVFESLMQLRNEFTFPLLSAGLLMPIAIVCVIVTTVFAYISWLKNEEFKKFCFLFSLCAMMFQTLTLICTWFIALQLKDSSIRGTIVNADMKGGISYASFVSLILTFVVAIIACAYNYFLDNFDDEDEEEEEEDDDDEEEVVVVRKKKKFVYVDDEEDEEEEVKPKKVSSSQPAKVKPESTGGEKFIKVQSASKTASKTTNSKSTKK